MAEDWASKIRESMDRSSKAMDLYRRQTQAGMMNAQSGGTTRYTAIENGGITDLGSFTPAPAGMSSSQFSGGPIESASFFGSGQIREMGDTMTPDGRPPNRRPPTPASRRGSFMPPNQQTPRQRFTA